MSRYRGLKTSNDGAQSLRYSRLGVFQTVGPEHALEVYQHCPYVSISPTKKKYKFQTR